MLRNGRQKGISFIVGRMASDATQKPFPRAEDGLYPLEHYIDQVLPNGGWFRIA